MILSIMHALTYVRRLCRTIICVCMHTFVYIDFSLLVCHFLCSEDSVVHFCLQQVSSAGSVTLLWTVFPGYPVLPEQLFLFLVAFLCIISLAPVTLISKGKLALTALLSLAPEHWFSLPALKFFTWSLFFTWLWGV